MRLSLVAVLVVTVAGLVAATRAAAAPVPRQVWGTPHPRGLDLADLVPAAGRLDYVWYVPAGKTVPQVVVAWHFDTSHPVASWNDPRRYVLTLWSPVDVTPGEARWVPHTLIRASPFSLVGPSVRLADVTDDGHDDLLVTVMCDDCNHATAVVSVYADVRGTVKRIYGHGYMSVTKGLRPDVGVQGSMISETAWGARDGLIWFDVPGGESSVCCPTFRWETFLRWTDGRGWRAVEQRRAPVNDPLLRQGYPAP